MRPNADPVPTTGRPMDPTDVDQLAARYRAGTTLQVLAEETGLPVLRVAELLGHAGVTRRSERWSTRPVELDLDEVVARYEAGETARSIGEAMGVSSSTIRRRLIKAGVWRGRS